MVTELPGQVWTLIKIWRRLMEIILLSLQYFENTFGKHSNPPPVTLSKAKELILSGAMAANLQEIIPPGCKQPKFQSNERLGKHMQEFISTISWIPSHDKDECPSICKVNAAGLCKIEEIKMTHPWNDQRDELFSSPYDPTEQEHPLPWESFCNTILT